MEIKFLEPIVKRKEAVYKEVKECFAKAWDFVNIYKVTLGTRFCEDQHFRHRKKLLIKNLK